MSLVSFTIFMRLEFSQIFKYLHNVEVQNLIYIWLFLLVFSLIIFVRYFSIKGYSLIECNCTHIWVTHMHIVHANLLNNKSPT